MLPPTTALDGAVLVNEMDCAALFTVNDCCICGAAFQLLLPAWLASIVQVPPVRKVTTPAEMEQTEALDGSMVNVTGSPEVAVAVGVYVPFTVAGLGGELAKEMAWLPGPTANDCCTCGAGA